MNNIEKIKEIIKNNEIDEILHSLYQIDDLSEVKKRYLNLITSFEASYSSQIISIYSSPGRSEICGNHTDHQNGKVLAAAINLDSVAIVSKRIDNIISLKSKGFDSVEIDISDLEKKENEIDTSTSLIRGICARIKELGYNVGGLNIQMDSNVLVGAGLSSSASFEVLIARILAGEYNDNKISAIEIAKISQYSENHYFGKPCGLMDQMACSVGGIIALDLKSEDIVIEKIDFDFKQSKYYLCIIDTKGSHANLTQEYANITYEMSSVAQYFKKSKLREVEENIFYEQLPELKDKVSDRAILRSIHYFSENKRVEKIVKALEEKNFQEFLKQVNESGNSSFKYLQNIYASNDVSKQNITLGIAIASQLLDSDGAIRVHGGGFAGTIQAFVNEEKLAEFKDKMDAFFGTDSTHVLRVRSHGAIKII